MRPPMAWAAVLLSALQADNPALLHKALRMAIEDAEAGACSSPLNATVKISWKEADEDMWGRSEFGDEW